MNNVITKKFFLLSFFIHIFVIVFFSFFKPEENIQKHFLVYGAHSKKPTHSYFKPLKAPPKTDWLKNRSDLIQKPTIKAENILKQKTNISSKKQPIKKRKIKTPKVTKNIKKNASKENIKTALKQEKKQIIKNEKKIKAKVEKKQIIKQTEKKIEPKIEQKQQEIQVQNETLKENTEEELHFNLMGESNPELVAYQKYIQMEVERVWHPPVGVPKGTECSLTFIINTEGNIEEFEITKRSNILVYDLSILRVAKNFKFDKSLWNKKFSIDFRQ